MTDDRDAIPGSRHRLSPDDERFLRAFGAGDLTPAEFDHRAHLRLAYIHLVQRGLDHAAGAMRDSLAGFLQHHGIDRGKYHETLTVAWILAVRHFMERSPAADGADEFIDRNPMMLDSKIMLTHYSADLLFSPEARARFAEPNLDPIPRYGA